MTGDDRLQKVRGAFGAYASSEREVIEALLSDDLMFFSPPDPGIDRQTYFELCWPAHETAESFDFVRLIEDGNEVVATYEATKTDGKRFRNTEVFTFDEDKICKVEVYFGWNL